MVSDTIGVGSRGARVTPKYQVGGPPRPPKHIQNTLVIADAPPPPPPSRNIFLRLCII